MSDPAPKRFPRVLRRGRAASRVMVLEPERRHHPWLSAQSAPLLLVVAFAVTIFIGTILLSLPVSSRDGTWTTPVESVFVATSAVCVTGLSPVDTAEHWSYFGQAVILLLIQFGGLGFMTSATLIFLLLGWRVGVRERILLSQTLDVARIG